MLWQPASTADTASAMTCARRVNASDLMELRINDDIGWKIVPGKNVGGF